MAESLHMSRRTLIRRLKNENTTYKRLLDDVRQDIAMNILKNTKKPLNHIHRLVGFSDYESFSRAFKSWTGATPTAFREGNI